MARDGNLERDDSTDFEAMFQFLPFACLYALLGIYSTSKLLKNFSPMKPVIRIVFINVSLFFFLRTFYWLDPLLAYPAVIYFYFELFPYFWLITICSLLSFSWLKTAWLFIHDQPNGMISKLGWSVGAANCFMYTGFTVMYFVDWFLFRHRLMLIARIQNNAWLLICMAFLIYSGLMLSSIVGRYLNPTYRKRILVMMITALTCLTLRLVINTLLLALAPQLADWKRARGGRTHTAFSILDYVITEVAFLFFLAYAIQVPLRDKETVTLSEDSYISDIEHRDITGDITARLAPSEIK
mmetsp:Transcript_26502/g.47575  ORF Transcript_26502/g.47575 Transcript_26502/m.47575 type:complete len:297 (+) Transcript_26502:2257-3147(+)